MTAIVPHTQDREVKTHILSSGTSHYRRHKGVPPGGGGGVETVCPRTKNNHLVFPVQSFLLWCTRVHLFQTAFKIMWLLLKISLCHVLEMTSWKSCDQRLVAFLATTYFELERKLNRARCCEGVAVFVDWSSFGLLSLEVRIIATIRKCTGLFVQPPASSYKFSLLVFIVFIYYQFGELV